jgi:hypothetical protein
MDVKSFISLRPSSMRRDVIGVADLAAEDLVALSAVVRLGPTLQVQLRVVALEGGLALQVDVANLEPKSQNFLNRRQ